MKRNYTTPDRETQRRVSAQRRELLEEIEKADEAYAEAFNAYRDVLDALNAHHLSRDAGGGTRQRNL